MSSRSQNAITLPSSLTSLSRRRWLRNARKELENRQRSDQIPPFIIPSSYYEIIHVHRFTSSRTIQMLIDHCESCSRYSIDTESDRFTNELSLIQIHSIPRSLPSFVILLELKQLPALKSTLHDQIKILLHRVFRLGNTIYSWGPLSKELAPIIAMDLITVLGPALLINLQAEFFNWYRGTQPPCEVCCPIQSSTPISSRSSSCSCDIPSPYVGAHEVWSLQNATLYTSGLFLDKKMTRRSWSVMLDCHYSPLSEKERQQRVIYAIHDTFAVTYLHRPIQERWSLCTLRESELTDLFISFDQPNLYLSSLSMFLEDISEDENIATSVVLHSPLSIHGHPRPLADTTRPIDDSGKVISGRSLHDLASSHPGSLPTEPLRPRRAIRSADARKRRNRKRNRVLRPLRDQHVLLRSIYHRFTMRQIKQILREREVRYFHLKVDRRIDSLSIGVKKSTLVDDYFDRIPGDLFSEHSYKQYRGWERPVIQ